MDFYQRKEKMFKIIDQLIKENKHKIEEIVFDSIKNTGIGEKTARNYIKKLLEFGAIQENNGILEWKRPQNVL